MLRKCADSPNPAGSYCGSLGFLLHSEGPTHARTWPAHLPAANQPAKSLGAAFGSISKKPETSAGRACGIRNQTYRFTWERYRESPRSFVQKQEQRSRAAEQGFASELQTTSRIALWIGRVPV
jgi:hypothetical protein